MAGYGGVHPAETRTRSCSRGGAPGWVSLAPSLSGTRLGTVSARTAGAPSVAAGRARAAPPLPAAGNVSPGLSGTGICLGGGTAGPEYALVAFNSAAPDTI